MKKYLAFALIAFCVYSLKAQTARDLLKSLQFRNTGPAFMTGRIADVAKDDHNPSTWYVATASSGVWKTTNNGNTWAPIFDQYGSYSTGCIAIDPRNPQVIWLGTGENQSQRSVGWGDGIYKSIDAGRTWANMGLRNSEHIGRISIDPRNPDLVLVAAQGPLWNAGGERGVYLTEDGGLNWNQVLEISENTGIAEIVRDPLNPDILYASSYQRRRHVGILVAGGPESRIFKSSDNGKSWKMLTKGLPNGDIGRIALAISPQKPNVVYAHLVAEKGEGGFYRSEDYGESWKKKNNYTIVDPQYYGEIYCDPHRYDHVYVMDVIIHFTTDGGESFERLNTRNKHVDNHSLLFDPNDPDYLMVGCDGGIYESWDRGDSWKFHDNLPITQFYRVGLDNDFPFYNIYGGTQDNSTIFAPSQTNTLHGITNSEWKLALGGDGFQARIDPKDPNTIYCQSQYAGIVRYDKNTGQRTELQPVVSDDEDPLRWHWDAPLIISPHNNRRLYFAAQKIFRSDDRGDSWTPVSGDLSRGENRNQREVMGKVWPPEAIWKNVFTSPYGTIVSLSESSINEGLIVAGTDDGIMQITTDGGDSWRRIDKFPGVPEKAYVADVLTSKHNTEKIYAVFNNHKEGDFSPYILKTEDLGKTWTPIVSGIGNKQACWVVLEDHKSPGLLFAGTEFGVFCSIDDGENWDQMKGGLPLIPVRDMEIQQREDDLVLATFGRGMWVLDDYSVLRQAMNMKSGENTIFPIKDTWTYFLKGDKGYGAKGVFGDNPYAAPNPPKGPIVNFYLNESFTSLAENRKKIKSGYPDYDILKKEDIQIEEEYFLLIRNEKGAVFNTQKVKNKKGFQQAEIQLSQTIYSDDGKLSRRGPAPLEGRFSVQICKATPEEVVPLSDEEAFELKYLAFSDEKPSEDYFEFYNGVTTLSLRMQQLSDSVNKKLELNNESRKRAIERNEGEKLPRLEAERLMLNEIKDILTGDETLISRAEYHHQGILSQVNNIYWNMRQSGQITNTHRKTKSRIEKKLADIEQVLNGH